MRKAGLVLGILLTSAGLSVQAEEPTQFDYLGLPIQSNTAEVTVAKTTGTRRDYLDLPIESSVSVNETAAVESYQSENTDCLGLPIEKAAVQTVKNNADYANRD